MVSVAEDGVMPNPDKPERRATIQDTKFNYNKHLFFVSLCLGGKNILLDKSFANMM
jgi:hypothetical protein